MVNNESQLLVHEQPKSSVAEAYRTLRTNIHFAKADGKLKTIMFTSAGPGEGKSTTAANTAVAMAQSGKQVIIIDCDLRKPVQHKIFGRSNNKGLTNILVDALPTAELIQNTGIENLRILTSGPIPPNPSELLDSGKMQEVLTYIQQNSDHVIIDAPPVIAVTDAAILTSKVDGTTLVLDAGTIRPEMAQKAKELLLKANGHILGVILNRVEIEDEYAYYYYYYGSDHKKKKHKHVKC